MPRVAGKKNQLRTLDEILHMCELDENLIPTIDFAHIHETGGELDSPEAFKRSLTGLRRYWARTG